MDIVGSAAAIIQLAGVGLTLAKTLYKEIGKVFEDESKATKSVISKNAITTATDIVTRCSATFDTLQEMADNARKTTMAFLMLPLRASRLKFLQWRLEQSKADLQLMMQIILYARLKNDTRLSVENEVDQRNRIEIAKGHFRFDVDEPHTWPAIPGEAVRNERLADFQKDFRSPLPRRRAWQSHESEANPLLREWTTIYDVLAPLNEEATGDESLNCRESTGREQNS